MPIIIEQDSLAERRALSVARERRLCRLLAAASLLAARDDRTIIRARGVASDGSSDSRELGQQKQARDRHR